jgi:hypothetical protein
LIQELIGAGAVEIIPIPVCGVNMTPRPREEAGKNISLSNDVAYAKGFADAKEQAAGIAEFHSGPSVQLANNIRTMTPKETK